METPVDIKKLKNLRKVQKEILIVELAKDIEDWEDLDDSLDIIKSRFEESISYEEAKEILRKAGKL